MPDQKFAFGFEANDASSYVITREISKIDVGYMELQGSYKQHETYTLQRYKGRTPLTEEDLQYLVGSGCYTFPITAIEWQALIGLVNNAAGANLPLVTLHN